jgi:hypothetical protein
LYKIKNGGEKGAWNPWGISSEVTFYNKFH